MDQLYRYIETSESKPSQPTIIRAKPISTAIRGGSEEVNGTTTFNTTRRCTERTRLLRLRAPSSPPIVRKTGISGNRFLHLLDNSHVIYWPRVDCVLLVEELESHLRNDSIPQIEKSKESNLLQIRGGPTSASPAAPAAAADGVFNTANRPQPILQILPATPLRKGPRGLIHCGPARRCRRRRRLFKLTGSASDGTGGSSRRGSGGSGSFRTDSLSATLRRSNGLLQQGGIFDICRLP